MVDILQSSTDKRLLVLHEASAYDCLAVLMIACFTEMIVWLKERGYKECLILMSAIRMYRVLARWRHQDRRAHTRATRA